MKKITALIIFLLATIFSLLTPSSISAAWTKYAGNPILEPGPPGNWDDQGGFGPSIMFQGGIYKMWYGGSGSYNGITAGRIGYASSPDGVNWTKHPANPVLDIDPPGSWEKNINQPTVIFDDGLYKMWFVSMGDYLGSGQEFFRIGYAYSTDGINWVKNNGPVLQGNPGSWEAEGVSAPNVLKIGSNYKMWYGARDSGGRWKIGLASSSDGINWNKNPNNPVIRPTESWEQSDADHLNTVYTGGNYEAWYHVGPGIPHNIVYAESGDGIVWTKPPSENPVLGRGPQSFDSVYIGTPYVIKQGDVYKMWYSGYDGVNWRLGYASTGEMPPFPTPTLIPTPTPTPTPTSTPTPTPTPTPIPGPRKVVFAPGLGGSWNADAILNCKTEGYAGDWTLAPYAADTYNPLLSALGENGRPFYYDWRKDVRNQATPLQNFINSLVNGGEKVNFVGHSLGGLVGRAYLENQGAGSELEKLLTVGSPHQGAPQAYPAWSAGEIWENNLIIRIATTILLRRCAARREEPRETLQRVVPSIQNLLPVFDYLRDIRTRLLKPVALMNAKNNWLPTGFLFYDVLVGTLSGNGFPTLNVIKVKERSPRDARLGNWVDGKPVGKEFTNEGDSTVLLLSTQLSGAENRIINQNHGGLVASNEGIAQILDFLGVGGMALATSFSEPKSALIIIGYPSNFWIMDKEGKLIKDKDGLASIINPGKNNYKFGLIPKSDKTLFIVAQFLEDGRVLWKEYDLKNRLPKFGKINFDPGNPQEDALHLGL